MPDGERTSSPTRPEQPHTVFGYFCAATMQPPLLELFELVNVLTDQVDNFALVLYLLLAHIRVAPPV